MSKYEKLTSQENTVIVRNNDDGSTSYIPTDPANSDYQEYLAQLEAE